MADTAPATLEDILRVSRQKLRGAGLDDPALEARILVEHFTQTTRAHAITAPRRPVEPEIADRILAAIERRRQGEPVFRIIGTREFCGLDFALSPATLEPRQDTETLVEEMAVVAAEIVARTGGCRILDLGTGTGAIALSLLSQVAHAHATGVDVSQGALETALLNAEALGVGDRFTTLHSDWFDAVSGRYDVIVSNPPYIPTGIIANLEPEVRDFDPPAALDGGEDGLDAYRRIAARAQEHLEAGGRVGVEIGHDQRLDVAVIFARSGFRLVGERRDLTGSDRVLVFAI